MSRTRVFVAGGLLWTVAVVDGLAHVVSGDLLAPALMVVAGIAGVGLIAARARSTEQLTPREMRGGTLPPASGTWPSGLSDR